MTWFGMHGYAAYIWSAYGVVFVVLTMNWWLIKRQRRQTFKILQQWFKRQKNDACS